MCLASSRVFFIRIVALLSHTTAAPTKVASSRPLLGDSTLSIDVDPQANRFNVDDPGPALATRVFKTYAYHNSSSDSEVGFSFFFFLALFFSATFCLIFVFSAWYPTGSLSTTFSP